MMRRLDLNSKMLSGFGKTNRADIFRKQKAKKMNELSEKLDKIRNNKNDLKDLVTLACGLADVVAQFYPNPRVQSVIESTKRKLLIALDVAPGAAEEAALSIITVAEKQVINSSDPAFLNKASAAINNFLEGG